MKTSAKLVVCMASVCASVIGSPLQAPSNSVHRVTWNLTPLKLEGGQPVKFDIGSLAPGCRWLFGVRVHKEEKDAQISALSLQTAPVELLPNRFYIKTVTPIPPSAFERHRDGLVWRPESPAHSLIVFYLSTAVKTRVEVTEHGRPIFTGDVSDSLFLENGSIVSAPLNGLHTMMLYATNPLGMEQPSGVQKVGQRFVATSAALKENLLELSLPTSMPRVSSIGNSIPLSLTIDVDTSGRVTDVRSNKGSEAILGPLKPQILLWRFRPFVWEGKTVPIHAQLLFLSDPQGNVRGPVNLIGEQSGRATGGLGLARQSNMKCCSENRSQRP